MSNYNIESSLNNSCPICNKHCNYSTSLPCSNCKHLVHQKCCKVTLNSFKHLDSRKEWMYYSCSLTIFPFQSLLNLDLTDESINSVPTSISKVHINELRVNFNLDTTLGHGNDDESNEFISLHASNNCDYYDAADIDKLLTNYITNDRSLKIFNTNIRSLKSNHDNLINLLSSIKTKLNVISLTETWNDIVNNGAFLPDSIEGYNDYFGTPGTTQNSGCGLYIREGINYTRRQKLDYHFHDHEHEFEATCVKLTHCIVYIEIISGNSITNCLVTDTNVRRSIDVRSRVNCHCRSIMFVSCMLLLYRKVTYLFINIVENK